MKFIRHLNNKKGSQMVEAAISLPVVIITTMLLVRLFVFYMDILTSGVKAHREAMEAQDTYSGAMIRTYETEEELTLLSGGVLRRNVSKRLDVRTYLINEDFLVRSGEVLD